MAILPIHERLAELWTKRSRHRLTAEEEMDLEHCLQVNAEYCRQLANLYNLSLVASMTGDIEWQHDICRKIEKFEGRPPASPQP
ncbi:hypothetical protein ACFPYJ_19620 [Paenibacillus solisilvae]|uniref:DUF2508 family protein n=1 Tax=Paenibacillus solisilvae TaxID=2486751 RepID=A0ABW0VZH6_9BACL